MSRFLTRLVLPLAILAFFAQCITALPTNVEERVVKNLRILPLGDSITWGFKTKGVGSNGYRLQLRNRLRDDSFNVKYVGTQNSGSMKDNTANEGYPGKTISQLQDLMGPALKMTPNIVLLQAGTNDLNKKDTPESEVKDAPNRLSNLIDAIVKSRPQALLVVAKITPAKDSKTAAKIKDFNNAIPAIVAAKRAKGNKVIMVDQSVLKLSDLRDGVHPTAEGYDKMGDIWYDGIKKGIQEGLLK